MQCAHHGACSAWGLAVKADQAASTVNGYHAIPQVLACMSGPNARPNLFAATPLRQRGPSGQQRLPEQGLEEQVCCRCCGSQAQTSSQHWSGPGPQLHHLHQHPVLLFHS